MNTCNISKVLKVLRSSGGITIIFITIKYADYILNSLISCLSEVFLWYWCFDI